MSTKYNKTSPLKQALLETANDMHGIGLLGKEAYEKITMRHLGAVKQLSRAHTVRGELVEP